VLSHLDSKCEYLLGINDLMWTRFTRNRVRPRGLCVRVPAPEGPKEGAVGELAPGGPRRFGDHRDEAVRGQSVVDAQDGWGFVPARTHHISSPSAQAANCVMQYSA
jgi:hypothetical protein